MASTKSPESAVDERREALEALAESDLPCAEIADALLDLADNSNAGDRKEVATA